MKVRTVSLMMKGLFAAQQFGFARLGGACTGRRNRTPAFTVLELLVVVTIVATLAGLVIPGLEKVKEDTRRIVCAHNLGQLGAGLKVYAVENGGRYPVEEFCGNPQCVLVGGLFPQYIAERGLFFCPSAEEFESYAQSGAYGGPGGDSVVETDENWQRHYITYKYFSVTRRDTRMPLPLLLSEYPHLLRYDSPPSRWLMSDWVRKDVPVFPHREKGGWGGGRNVLFADTSVRFVRHRTPYAFTERQ